MGVMTCARYRCDNILCRTYIRSIGYICRECQQEFKNYLPTQRDIILDSESQIIKALQKFINIPQGSCDNIPSINIDEFFKSHTQDY